MSSGLRLALILLLLFCMPAHAGLFSVSEKNEITIGRQASLQIERKAPVLWNAFIQQYISGLRSRTGRCHCP